MQSRGPKVTGTFKEIYLSGPTLERPDPSIRFYIKTDWYKDGISHVLLQADVSAEAMKSGTQEKDGGKCEIDKSLKVMRLRTINSI